MSDYENVKTYSNNETYPGCHITYNINNQSQNVVYIEDFHCDSSQGARKGDGRKLMRAFLRRIKKKNPQLEYVTLISSPYTTTPNPDFMANRAKYQRKLDDYYKSLGFTIDTSMDETYEEGDASHMFATINSVSRTIKKHKKGGTQKKNRKTKNRKNKKPEKQKPEENKK